MMSGASYDLNDKCVTMKATSDQESAVGLNNNHGWIKKTAREGCQVFIPRDFYSSSSPYSPSQREKERRKEEEEKNQHDYKYKLYKNYYHILSFLHSFIYSIISTFILLLFTNKVSTFFRTSFLRIINPLPSSLTSFDEGFLRAPLPPP